jgi:hypothetical protein
MNTKILARFESPNTGRRSYRLFATLALAMAHFERYQLYNFQVVEITFGRAGVSNRLSDHWPTW